MQLAELHAALAAATGEQEPLAREPGDPHEETSEQEPLAREPGDPHEETSEEPDGNWPLWLISQPSSISQLHESSTPSSPLEPMLLTVRWSWS